MKTKLGNYIFQYSEKNKDDEEIPVYSVTNDRGFCTGYFDKEVASKDKTSYKIVPRGYFAYNPSRINVGSVAYQDQEDRVIVSPLYNVFGITENMDMKYLYYYLKSDITQYFINQYARGGVRNNLKFEKLCDFLINVPGINEQKRIVAILDQISSLINICNQQINNYQLLIWSKFIETFGDLERGTCKTRQKSLKELSTKISDGVHAKPDYKDSGKPFISVVNITRRKIDFSDCKYVSEDDYKKMTKSTKPEKGDVLYTKIGATYGIPAYIDTDEEFGLYVSVCLIKPKHDCINGRFLAYQLDMPFIKHQADRRIKGIGVPDLHLNQIGEFNIVCPTMEEQVDFLKFADHVSELKSVAETTLDKLEVLKRTLIQQYYE